MNKKIISKDLTNTSKVKVLSRICFKFNLIKHNMSQRKPYTSNQSKPYDSKPESTKPVEVKKPAAQKPQVAKGIVTDDFANAFKMAGSGGWGAVKIPSPKKVEPPQVELPKV